MPNFRIAMLSLHSCPLGQLGTRDTGGMNVYVRELARHLGALGHRVDIYTRAHDPRDTMIESPYKNVRLIHIQAGRVEDMGKMAQLSHLAEFTGNLTAFAAEDGACYDVIHSHYWLSALAGEQFARMWGAPHVVMFHTLGAVKNSLPVGEAEPDVRLAAEQEITKACHRVVAATVGEKLLLTRFYGIPADKIDVVPCGVNLELFKPADRSNSRLKLGISPGAGVLLSVGRIEPLKGLDRVIEAAGILGRPELKLLIIGGDEHRTPELKRLKNLVKELGLDDRVSFPGPVKQTELPLYYSAADISIVGSYYESFCLVILESLACGTRVVSTDVGIAPQIIKNGFNGFVVPGNASISLAQGIERGLACGPAQAISIRKSVSEYGWPVIAGKIASVYEAALPVAPLPRGLA